MRVQMSRTVDAPIERVWEIVADRYVDAGAWASAVYASSARPGAPVAPGAPAMGRVCQTSLGAFTETIEAWDPAARMLTYSATGDRMPGFVRNLRNTWTLAPLGGGRTEARVALSADIAFPFNVLMGWLMKRQFRSAIGDTLDDLAAYAETGQVSARKGAADRPEKARAARAAAGQPA